VATNFAEVKSIAWKVIDERFGTPTDGNFVVGDGTNWVKESGATARTSLGAVGLTGDETIAGTKTFSSDVVLSSGGVAQGPNANGTSRLDRDSATVISLGVGQIPLKVSGVWMMRRLTAAVTTSNGGLSASTLYYVYAADSSGTILEFSTTAPTTDTTFGVRIKTGDATRTLVGRVVTTSASQFVNDAAVAIGVVSWFRPTRYVRVDHHLFGPNTYNATDQADSASAYAWPGGSLSSSNTVAWGLGGTVRIGYAVFDVQWQSNNTGNTTRLVHSDDGPANITQIAEAISDGTGNPINSGIIITTELQALQDSLTVHKNIGWQALKVNGTTLRYYAVRLRVVYELTDPF